jgi:protein-S-isoprenylcysteine O-methyltransferase Ste14
VLELVNIPLQFVIWFRLIDLPVTTPNLIGFALFAILLVQGAAYWTAKLRQPARSPLPGAGAFAVARVANPVLLAVGLAFLGWSVARDPGAGTLPGLGFALFAVLEYVNYFHVQLMYDNAEDLRYLRTHGLRRAHLARDLGPVDARES